MGSGPDVTPAAAGMVLHVWHGNRELADPSTRAVLGVMMDPVGTIRIATVRDNISIATIAEGNPPARGDIVKPGWKPLKQSPRRRRNRQLEEAPPMQ